MLICITGVSGVGKSTILSELALRGYNIKILDQVIHKLYLFNKEGYKIIKQNFGNEFVNQNEVDRKKLGYLVFNNIKELKKLNDLLQPLITKIIIDLKKANKNKLLLIEAAALLNNYDKYAKLFDRVILIKAPQKLINANLKVKFKHLDSNFKNPIKIKRNLNFDLVINNNTSITKACEILEEYLSSLSLKNNK